MSRQANPTLIGAFVLGAITLAVTTILLVAGGEWFRERRQHAIYFEGAAQGLQVGSPVMFLGVKVGTVKRIQLGLDEESRRFLVPVTIEVEPSVAQSRHGERIDLQDHDTIRQLVERGLRAQLRMQSLLTGQLYVDLDFHPDKPANFLAIDKSISEIPAIPTTVEELSSKFEGFPMETFLADTAAIVKSINTILANPTIGELPKKLAATLDHLEALAKRLDKESGPVLAEVKADLALTREALASARAAAEKAGAAADRIGAAAGQTGDAAKAAAEKAGNAADRIGGMANSGARLFDGLAQAGQDLAQAAKSLRALTDEDSPAVPGLNSAMQEIARAARALRLLAETLEQQPEAVIRGKKSEEGQ